LVRWLLPLVLIICFPAELGRGAFDLFYFILFFEKKIFYD